MQAKISIRQMSRSRQMRFENLFVGNDAKGEVRAQWSSLYQAFYRNQFMMLLDMKQMERGGRDIDEVTQDFTEMFERIESWCDANCTGLWTIWDNDAELNREAPNLLIEAIFMFEYEEDLIRFIRDCAVMMKLTY